MNHCNTVETGHVACDSLGWDEVSRETVPGADPVTVRPDLDIDFYHTQGVVLPQITIDDPNGWDQGGGGMNYVGGLAMMWSLPVFECSGRLEYRITVKHQGTFTNTAEEANIQTGMIHNSSNQYGLFPELLIDNALSLIPFREVSGKFSSEQVLIGASFSVKPIIQYHIQSLEFFILHVVDGRISFTGNFHHDRYNPDGTISEFNPSAQMFYRFIPDGIIQCHQRDLVALRPREDRITVADLQSYRPAITNTNP